MTKRCVSFTKKKKKLIDKITCFKWIELKLDIKEKKKQIYINYKRRDQLEISYIINTYSDRQK